MKQECPVSRRGADTGKGRTASAGYQPERKEQGIDALAEVYLGHTIDAERLLISAGWRDTIGLVNVAIDAGLTGEHFVDPVNVYLFEYLCTCGQLDLWPSIGEALSLARRRPYVSLELPELDRVLWHYETVAGMLGDYAETVVANARSRERAQECLREGVEILLGTLAFDFHLVIRPHANVSHKGGPGDR